MIFGLISIFTSFQTPMPCLLSLTGHGKFRPCHPTLADNPATPTVFEGLYLLDIPSGNYTQLALDYMGNIVPGNAPRGIYVDGSGNIFISFDEHVDVFSSMYELKSSLGASEGMSNPSDMLYINGHLNVVDTDNNRILEYSLSASETYIYEGSWTAPSWPGMTSPKHLNVTSDGKEILLSGAGKVLIMDSDKEIAGIPLDDGHLTDPRGVDGIDRSDGARVYFVADAGSNAIYRYIIREDDHEARQVWDNFLEAIGVSNFTAAREYMHPVSRDWFDSYIKKLGLNAPLISAKLSNGSNLKLKWITKDAAEFYLFFTADIFKTGPQYYAAEISFIRDKNGDWKIMSF